MKLYLAVIALIFLTTSVSAQCGDLLHASCELNWIFRNCSCPALLNQIQKQFKNCCVDDNIVQQYRNYTLLAFTPATLTVSGKITYPTTNDIDTQTITLTQNGADCRGYGCSESEAYGWDDEGGNFCDLHNLIRGLGYDYIENIGECEYHPSYADRDTVCNKL